MARILVPDGPAIADAAAVLRAGGLVVMPTETVYGLAADATSGPAVARIFAAKDRPRFNPLIVHVADLAAACRLGVFSPVAQALAARFWPGPLSLVVPRQPDCAASDLVSAGLPTIALRVPAHPVAQALLAAADRPLAAPSANPSGRLSPTRAEDAARMLGAAVDIVLNGGPCAAGLESTVIGVAGPVPVLLRPGALPRQAIEAVSGPLGQPGHAHDPLGSPGRTLRHYAPRTRLRLNAQGPRPGEVLLGFGPLPPDAPPGSLTLSAGRDLTEAAAQLFAHLHALDACGADAIAVQPIPDTGLGEAINDRLTRAAEDA